MLLRAQLHYLESIPRRRWTELGRRKAGPGPAPLRLWADRLEDRLAPAVLDLTSLGAVASLNNAAAGNPVIFGQTSPQSTGSGVIQSFVRLEGKNNDGLEQGYNSDNRPVEFDENTTATFNHSLLLSSVPRVNIGGRMYREFFLDINQSGGANSPSRLLSLDELRFYTSNDNTLHGYNAGTGTLGGVAPLYDLDAGGDNWIKLDANLTSGSGSSDMRAFIPDSLFDPSNAFVTVYSKFGVNHPANDGFEEWSVGAGGVATVATGRIHGYKFSDVNGDGLENDGPGGTSSLRVAGVTIYLDANNNGVKDADEASTTTGPTGEYEFRNLAAELGTFSTYRVRELPPAGSTQTTPNPPEIILLKGDVYVAAANQPGSLPLLPRETQKVEPKLAFGNEFNQAPVANSDAYTTAEDTTLTVAAPGVLANDTDPNADSLTAVLVSGPANGSLTLNADGSFTYTPAANFNGSDSFTYKANDGQADSNVATVTITVTAVNDAPVAVNDAYSTNEDATLSVPAPGVLGNDTDADGDSLSATLLSGPAHGTLTLNADGSFTYTPAANFSGSDSFTYRATDGTATSNDATVFITVTSVNDAPVAAPDAYTTNEDTTLTVAAPGVLGNDVDADGDSLTAVLVSSPANGMLALNADGSFTYTPNANFNGADSFSYKASDGTTDSNTVTVTLTVNAVNDAPVANNDAYTTSEDTPLVVPAPGVLGNDTDIDGDALTAVLVSGPSHGTLVLNADGSFTYTPDANFNGSDSFSYQASDGTATSNVATVTLTVTAVNDAPVAAPDAYTTDEDTTLTVPAPGVLGNDTDVDGDDLSAVLVTNVSHGTLTLNADGSFTYTPNANFNGTDSFSYKASDGTTDSNTVTVTLTLTPVNDAPVTAPDGPYTTAEDTPLFVPAPGVLANDTDVDGDPLIAVLASPPANGSVVLNADGSFTYTPNANFNGTDSFTYVAQDPSGAHSAPTTVSLVVTPVNDAPVAVNDTYSTPEDTTLTVAAPGVLGNDMDVDGDTLTAVLVSGPSHGTLTLNSNGSFTYTPAANYNGPDSFTYKANDGAADSNTTTVALTVTPVNDAPVGANDAYSTAEDTPLVVLPPGVLGNDTDVDGDVLTAVLVDGPAHGTLILNADGSFAYTPDANYNGPDSFTYRATDGQAFSNVATVALTVTPVNDAPVAAPDNYTATEDTTLNVPAPGVLGNDTDADGDTLTAVLVTGPANGTLTLNADGSFTYTPDANFNVADAFTYKANDGTAYSNVTTVTIEVTPVNDAPVVTTINITPQQSNEGQLVHLTATFTDPDLADSHTATINWGDGTTTTGTVTPNGDGTYTVTGDYAYLDDDPTGTPQDTYTVTVTVTDLAGASGSKSAPHVVKNVPPVIGEVACPPAPVPVGTPVAVAGTFTDAGVRDTHTAVWDWGDGTTSPGVVAEAGGSGTVTGTHTYTAAGVYTLTLTVRDDDGGSATHVCETFVVVFGLDTKVTGGGWINSPPGAAPARPNATGKANFGFNAKYHVGSTTPTGQTNFRFAPGNLHFHSTSYDPLSLIVTNPAPGVQRAEWRGSGWINGAGDYAFKVMVIDAGEPGSSDKFRIRIWDKITQAVIYDNEMGAPDAASPTTPLGGGNIQVHNFLHVAGGAIAGAPEPALTRDELTPVVAAALARWAAAGANGEALSVLNRFEFRVADLPDTALGVMTPGVIWIDVDAAGVGWFVDPTPGDDGEFILPGDQGEQGRVDLLSVVAHELGHALGLGHSEDEGVMHEELGPGVRLVPGCGCPACAAAAGAAAVTVRDSSGDGTQDLIARVGPSGAPVATVFIGTGDFGSRPPFLPTSFPPSPGATGGSTDGRGSGPRAGQDTDSFPEAGVTPTGGPRRDTVSPAGQTTFAGSGPTSDPFDRLTEDLVFNGVFTA